MMDIIDMTQEEAPKNETNEKVVKNPLFGVVLPKKYRSRAASMIMDKPKQEQESSTGSKSLPEGKKKVSMEKLLGVFGHK